MSLWSFCLIMLIASTAGQFASECSLRLGDASETAALKELFVATQGSTWFITNLWNSQEDPCCWLGITCSIISGRGVHVTGINLSKNNLKGQLPASFTQFTYLSQMVLHENQIGGQVPDLSRMLYLELVFLHANNFQGPVPSVRTLTRLEALYLENNTFTGGFPDIANLANLEAVDVSNNVGLTGALPTSLDRATKLRDVRANGCKFTGPLPPKWVSGSNRVLQAVQLNDNLLTGAIPPISNQIKVLYLERNKFGCYAPEISGADIRVTGNKFLCEPGLARKPGCAAPAIQALVSPPGGDVRVGDQPQDVPVTFTVDDLDPLSGCSGLYCYLGAARQSVATLSGDRFSCNVKPLSVGSYTLSLRTQDGLVVTQQPSGQAIVIRVKADCGGPQKMCNGHGVCTDDGCVCNQKDGWTGNACDQRLCPRNCFQSQDTDGVTCSGGVTCTGGGKCDATTGKCKDQGVCDRSTGVCTCNAGFDGADCSIKAVPCPTFQGMPCGGRGLCQSETGVCNCFPKLKMDGTISFIERYDGNACQNIVCPIVNEKECSGHGTCDSTSGCRCFTNFSGPACEVGNLPCSNCQSQNALCDGNTGQCRCACVTTTELIDNRNVTTRTCYKGNNCEDIECPKGITNPDAAPDDQVRVECSGHGDCNDKTGDCTCNANWDVYSNCEVERKPCPNHPNGMPCGGPMYGNCRQTTGKCTCANNDRRAFIGVACEIPTCPTTWENCNAGGELTPAGEPVRGKCVGDTCECNAGFGGLQCNDKQCKLGPDGSQCNEDSGQGECDVGSGICICFKQTAGEGDPKTACATFLCPGSNHERDCNGRGTCDNGKCICDSDFTGDACDEEKVDPVPIVLGVLFALCCVISCAVGMFCFLRRQAIAKHQEH